MRKIFLTPGLFPALGALAQGPVTRTAHHANGYGIVSYLPTTPITPP